MRTPTALLIAVLGVLLPPASAAAESGRVSGIVLSPTGERVSGADVDVFRPEGDREQRRRLVTGAERAALARTRTGDHGRFSAELDVDGIVEVAVRAPGHAPWVTDVLATGDLGVVQLEAAPERRGRVTVAGRPLAGARVIFLDGPGRVVEVRTTAEDGTYTVADPDRWTFGMAVLGPGGQPIWISATEKEHRGFHHFPGVPVREIPLDLDLSARSRWAGQVHDAAGRAVAGAEVLFRHWPVATSDSEGRFEVRLAGVDTTSYLEVFAGRPGTELSAVVEVDPRDPSPSPIVVRPASTVWLRVLDETGAEEAADRENEDGIAGASITVLGDIDPGSLRLVTEARGTAELLLGSGAKVTAWARAAGYEIEDDWRILGPESSATEPADPVFRAQRAFRLAGRVVDHEGRPVEGVFVSAASGAHPVPYRRRPGADVSDAGGRFRISPRVPETGVAGDVVVALGETSPAGRAPVPPAGDGDLEIRLPHPVELVVRVRDPEGRGVEGAQVRVIAGVAPGRWAFGLDEDRSWLHAAGADGTARLALGPGRHDLRVVAPGFVAREVLGARAEPGGRTEPIDVALERTVEVDGRVTDEGGRAVPGVRVVIGDREEVAGVTTTDATGTFLLGGLPPKTLQLHVQGEGLLPTEPRAVTAPASGVEVHVSRGGVLEGRVVDGATIEPLPGARVRAVSVGVPSAEASEAEGVAGDDGSFVLSGLAFGRVEVRAETEGYVDWRGEHVLDPDSGPDWLDLALERGTTLRGVVVGEGGEPVVGASLEVSVGERETAETIDRRGSDRHGEFEADGLPLARVVLRVEKGGFLPDERRLDLRGGGTHEVRIELERGGRLKGLVRTPVGDPLQGATVSAAGSDPAASSGRATTDAQGRFEITGLTEHSFRVEAFKSGYRTDRVEAVSPAAGEELDLVLEPVPTGTVVGSVRGRAGDETLTVRIRSSEHSIGLEVDPDGSFRAENAPAGDVGVHLSITSDGTERELLRRAFLPEGGEVHVEFDLGNTVELSGRVVRNGEGVVGAWLHLFARGTGHSSSTTTGEEGAYHLELPTGTYRVQVSGPLSRTNLVRSVELERSRVVDFDLTGARLAGRVVDLSTGGAVGDARVEIRFRSTDTSDQGLGSVELETDGAGGFVFPRAPTGPLRLRVAAPEYAPRVLDLDLEVGEERAIEVELEAATGLRVTLVDGRTGLPVRGTVVARDLRDVVVFDGDPPREGDGVSLPLGPGGYKISVSAPGLASRTVRATVPSEGLVLPLTPGGTLLVRAATLERRVAKLVAPDGEEYVRCWCNRISSFHVEGSETRIPNVEPGVYAFVVLDEGGANETYSVEIVEGGVTELAIR